MATNERDQQALELRRAGVAVPVIRERLGFRTRSDAEAAIVRALGEASPLQSPRAMRDLELDRLDRLQQSLWILAAKGDVAAVDRVLALASARLRIAAMNETQNETPMLLAFNETVAALPDVTKVDAALVQLGRRIAARIDAAAGNLDPVTDTKALYLAPQLMNVLTQLGATPAARKAVAGGSAAGEPTPKQSQKDDLAAWRAGRGIGA